MTTEKENGYNLINELFGELPGFMELWNKTDTETKDSIVIKAGESYIKRPDGLTKTDYDNYMIMINVFIKNLESKLEPLSEFEIKHLARLIKVSNKSYDEWYNQLDAISKSV
jgi:hypothetical protein